MLPLRTAKRTPNADIRADAARLLNLHDLIGHARDQSGNVTGLNNLVQLRSDLVRQSAVEIAPHVRVLDVRIHSWKG